MADQSHYTIEFRIIAACWYHESNKSAADIKLVKDKLRERFDVDPPRTSVIAAWEEKLFLAGSIVDKKHTGRPSERGDRQNEIKKSIRSDPMQSIRRRSDDIKYTEKYFTPSNDE